MFNRKIQDCLTRLDRWSHIKYGGSIRGAIESKEKEIQDLSNTDDVVDYNAIGKKKKELENLLEDDEIYWKQRAREDWLEWGDKNTKWFHMKANSRRKRNKIRGLMDDLGIWTEEDNGMELIANQYFGKLFQTSDPQMESISQVLETIPTSITEDQNTPLVKSFSREEILGVLKSMHPTKAPGPDGIQAVFYQKYWDIVGEDICSVYLKYLNEEQSLNEINKTLIALIPKLKDPTLMKDFRPINLCNVIYKIIAKALANRLKQMLDKIISPSQSASFQEDLLRIMPYSILNVFMQLKTERTGKMG